MLVGCLVHVALLVFSGIGVLDAILKRDPSWLLVPLVPGAAVAIWHAVNTAYEKRPTGVAVLNKRAATALQIRDALLAGRVPEQRFAVYLRPFLTSGRLTQSSGFSGLVEFETCLTDALQIGWEWPLVSIGRPGDKFGSGESLLMMTDGDTSCCSP